MAALLPGANTLGWRARRLRGAPRDPTAGGKPQLRDEDDDLAAADMEAQAATLI